MIYPHKKYFPHLLNACWLLLKFQCRAGLPVKAVSATSGISTSDILSFLNMHEIQGTTVST